VASSWHPVTDTVRLVVIGGAFWLSALVLRVTYVRWRRTRGDPDAVAGRVHWATAASYVLLLLITAGARAERLGRAPDEFLWPSALAVTLGMYGVVRRIRLSRLGRRDTKDRPG